jgi:hypothetical protein
MEHTIKLVEQATENAIKTRLKSTLNGISVDPNQEKGTAVYGNNRVCSANLYV